MRYITVKTPPAVEPVSLGEIKNHLSIDFTDQDALLQGKIRSLRLMVERKLDRALITQTLTLALDGFPCAWPGWISAATIRLRPPVQSVTSVTYLDPAGNSQTVSSANYILADTDPGRIAPKFGQYWPATAILPAAVKVEFIAGSTIPELVPDDIKSFIMLGVGMLYEHRETVISEGTFAQLPGADDLVASYAPILLA